MSMTQITRTEAKLFFRDPVPLFFGLVFPTLLILALGFFFPGFDEPDPAFGGLRYIDVYSNTILALGLATLGLVTLPPILGLYRQLGILRRLRLTPVGPARLLVAQLIVHSAVALLSGGLAFTAALVFFDVPFPAEPLWFLVSFVLTTASIFAIGLLIGARVATTNGGVGWGMGLYFPMLFFAGLWVPRFVMSDGLRFISDLTPLGSGVQAMEDSWLGSGPDPLNLIVLLAWAVVVSGLAVRFFKWE